MATSTAELISDIKIKINNKWLPARDYQIEAFKKFQEPDNFQRPLIIKLPNNISFTIYREKNKGIYLKRDDNTISPIADWNDVKVFLIDGLVGMQSSNWYGPANWGSARNYQTWAYYDYIYSNQKLQDIGYYSKETVNPPRGYIEIPLDGLEPNIIFKISKNDNGSICYEKNNLERSRVRISDNNDERSGYLGYYRRMTDNSSFLPSYISESIQSSHNATANANTTKIFPIPLGIDINKKAITNEDMCVVCNDMKQNIKFKPCNHTLTCYLCYVEICNKTPHKINECPVCRGKITNVIKS
jgi:hypothetical protein